MSINGMLKLLDQEVDRVQLELRRVRASNDALTFTNDGLRDRIEQHERDAGDAAETIAELRETVAGLGEQLRERR